MDQHTPSTPPKTPAPHHISDASGPGNTFDIRYFNRAVGCATDLTAREAGVLRHLACFADYTTGRNVRPSHELLCAELDMDERNLRRYIRRLCETGWLILERRSSGPGKTNIYRLGIGTHRAFFQRTPATETPDHTPELSTEGGKDYPPSDRMGGNSYPVKGGNSYPVKGVEITPLPSRPSMDLSSSGVTEHTTAPEQHEQAEEEEKITAITRAGFDSWVAAYGDRRCKAGSSAHEQAADAYADAVSKHGHAALTTALDTHPREPGEWPNQWLMRVSADLDSIRKQQRLHDAERRKSCPDCAGSGWTGGGYGQAAVKCSHPSLDVDELTRRRMTA